MKIARTDRLARRIEVVPLTPERWATFERLFGPRGACGGCWCMTPRLPRSEYEKNKGDGNRRAMKKRIEAGLVSGVLGIIGGEPFGWCSIEPRERISSLQRSRIFRPVDEATVWSIVCLFIDRRFRNQGLSVRLVRGALEWARAQGARLVEAYPVDPTKDPMPDVFAYPGPLRTYEAAGFREVARRSATRPIVRKKLRAMSPAKGRA